MKDVVEYIAKILVDNPDQVEVEEHIGRSGVTVSLHVAQGDMGRVIGKAGKVANAIRTLIRTMADEDERVSLEIAE